MGAKRTKKETLTKPSDETTKQRRGATQQLEQLFNISKLLTRFESFEKTVPEVLAIVASSVPLASAILLMDWGGAPESITWSRRGDDAERRAKVRAHAEAAFGYLTGSHVDSARDHTVAFELFDEAGAPATETQQGFVTLPLVVGHGRVFGVVQIEGAGELDETDLIFLNTTVNQLAVGLVRHFDDRALRASETKLDGIIAIAADAIISTDEHHRIRIFNAAAEKTFGYTKAEALGAPLDILIPERFRELHRQRIEKFAAGPVGTRRMGDTPTAIIGLRKNGEEFPAHATISKLLVNDTLVLTAAFRDITHELRAASRQRFLADIGEVIATTLDPRGALTNISNLAIDTVADVCIINVLDPSGDLERLEVVSRDPTKKGVCESLMQLPVDRQRPHLGGQVLETRRPALIARVLPEHLASFAHSEEHLRALRALEAHSIVAAPLLAHGELMGSVVFVSSTASRTYDEADVALVEETARRASLTIVNARLYREAQRAVRLRDEVLGIVAHDLRSPLGSIVMAARMLRRELKDPKRAEAIERAADRMNGLIQDLLDVNRMEAGQLTLKRAAVSAEQILSASLSAHEPVAAAASVALGVEVDPDLPDVWADGERLLQVLENLVGNALAHTEPGGRIVLGATTRDGEVMFSVADTGRGIAPEDLPHVFDRFWQARTAGDDGRDHAGGLGLPIVKGIVESHGGRIWVESGAKGSTFYFTVPIAPPFRETPV